MAGLQPATRRLLTEATAAATYRTAAQTAADADARIAAVKAKPSGLAALGADGIVPASQLPAVSVQGVVKATQTDRTGTTTATDDPELILANLSAGTYAVDLLTRHKCTSTTTSTARLSVTAGTLEGVLYGTNSGSPSAALSAYSPPGSPGATLATGGLLYVASTQTITVGMLRGILILSAAATLSFQFAPGSTTVTASLMPGSALRATRLGA